MLMPNHVPLLFRPTENLAGCVPVLGAPGLRTKQFQCRCHYLGVLQHQVPVIQKHFDRPSLIAWGRPDKSTVTAT